ncbi:MAG: ParB/RepB/Spo0J family partition protein [Nitrososphaeraceae archaeon]|nr:ParB/RepB/Spo0J family partition protein [Nitrososphaeraceae archaeon]MDW3625893.1 ParB/RepB/Spo0J family partition protein [Nitrososphaeraceae archaeon]MDW3630820.1 ParB/RepB/Spo0J family partition protein [Nitrososphaeraceae archaeon]
MEFVDTSIIEQIEMKMIRPSSFAVRDKFQKYCEDDESLIISIREHGLIQPILIRPLSHGFEIVAGHRRYQACKSLRWRFIPCKVCEMTNKQAFEIQLSENIQRKSMDPIEEAEAFRRYVIDFGWGGVSDLAKKIGKSEEYVSHRIQLLKLSEETKRKIASNMLNVSKAIEISTIPIEKQSEIVGEIIENNLSVKRIRELKMILRDNITEDYSNLGFASGNNYLSKSFKITKKASLSLKVTLARIDNLIEESQISIEPEQRTEIINFLMELRIRIHELIDDTIKFKNYNKKKIFRGKKNTRN